MKLSALERDASAVLNIPLLLAHADSATSLAELSAAEQACFAQFNFENRRRDLHDRQNSRWVMNVGGRSPNRKTAQSEPNQVDAEEDRKRVDA